MKKTLFGLLALIMVMAGFSFAETAKQFQFVDELGKPRTDLTYVYVYNAGTPTASTIYKNVGSQGAIAQPITPTSTNTTLLTHNGSFEFYSRFNRHDIIANVGGVKVKFENVSPQTPSLVVPRSVYPTFVQKKGSFFQFNVSPGMTTQATGLAPAITNDAVNLWIFPQGVLECRNTVQQDLFVPVLSADGIDVAMDQTNNDGVEITNGTLASSPSAFVVGTDGPFHFKLRIKLSHPADTDMCFMGFRKVQAYDDAIATYTDIAGLNCISGTIYTYTNLNDAASPTSTTTTDTISTTAKVLEVYVALDGAVTYKINGVAPTATTAFSFDVGDTVIPFFYFLHDTSVCDDIILSVWDCGLDAN